MFGHPAWAVGSYSNGPPAARSVGTKSTGGFNHPDGSPCRCNILKALVTNLQRRRPGGGDCLLCKVDDAPLDEVADAVVRVLHLGDLTKRMHPNYEQFITEIEFCSLVFALGAILQPNHCS